MATARLETNIENEQEYWRLTGTSLLGRYKMPVPNAGFATGAGGDVQDYCDDVRVGGVGMEADHGMTMYVIGSLDGAGLHLLFPSRLVA